MNINTAADKMRVALNEARAGRLAEALEHFMGNPYDVAAQIEADNALAAWKGQGE